MAIRFEGLEDCLESIDKIGDTSNLKAGMNKACATVEKSAKEKAPKSGGDLRRSIKSEVNGGSGDIEGVVFTSLFYAPYVEYGTGLFAENGGRKDVPWRYKDDSGDWWTTYGMNPNPFMRPALDENKSKIKRILKEALTK